MSQVFKSQVDCLPLNFQDGNPEIITNNYAFADVPGKD